MDDKFHIDERGYIIYNVLPPDKKIQYLSEIFKGGNYPEITQDYINSFFKNLSRRGAFEFNTLVVKTKTGNIVNIIFDKNIIHINASNMSDIRTFIHTVIHNGSILFKLSEVKPSDKFHLPCYARYIKLNRDVKYTFSVN